LFLRSFSFLAPAALCGTQEWGVGKGISRRCWRRNLPSLPRPYRVFKKYSINEFGDEPFIFILFEELNIPARNVIVDAGFDLGPVVRGKNWKANKRPGCL
jgi:hypothetical protein